MSIPNLQVRRATVEDLPTLLKLWREEGLPAEDLEHRFKEFQVAVDATGQILGTFALLIQGFEGWIHSEAFGHPEQADALREKLWERVQIQARNHGLVRIWTQLAVPFWHTNGFQYASQEVQARRPVSFTGDARPWLVTQLREEPVAAAASIDKEFALFKESEKEQRDRLLRQARVLKFVALTLALLVLAFVVVMTVRLLINQRQLQKPAPSAHP